MVLSKETQKSIADRKFIVRILEVLKLCDKNSISDTEGIKKLMRFSTKYMQKRFSILGAKE